MAFLSSVFSKLTETSNIGRARRTEANEAQLNLSCDGEVDDFVLFSKNENPPSLSDQDTGPPMYNQVMSQVNPTHSQPNVEQLPAYSELFKKSPIDDVPFHLWNGHMTMLRATGLLQEINSIVERSKDIRDVNISSRFKYSFESELSVLREFGDSPADMPQESCGEMSDRGNTLMDFGFEGQGLESTTNPEPRVGCLVDF